MILVLWKPAVIVAVMVSCQVHSFMPPTKQCTTNQRMTSSLMAKKRKITMKEKRKQRAKRRPSIEVDRGLLNDLPPVDQWEKTQQTSGEVQKKVKVIEDDTTSVDDDVDLEAQQTKAKASSLVESQRKSVDTLTYIRKRVEENPSLSYNEAARSILDKGNFVYNNFLSSDDEFGDNLLSEMLQECSDMLANDKLERDITRLGDGEYLTKLTGGESYADCPRLTEYVVSLTRHFPPLFNKELDMLEMTTEMTKLDATASMGTLRVYNRKTRQGESMLANPDEDSEKPFGVICGDSDDIDNDTRRLTAMLFLSSKDWDTSCGGGVTVESTGERVDAVRDRIVLLRSDSCSYRQEPWFGNDEGGLDLASCVIVHFVKENN